MEIPVHCTVSDHRRRTDVLRLALLTFAVPLVHGFHPWAEDGGLYVAGVELCLQPSLFPFDRAFVTAPAHYSLFAPAIACLIRLTHMPLGAMLLGLDLVSAALLLYAALRITRRCFPFQPQAQWVGVALLAAWWTLPIAGTSLLLMDPYLTARSISTPLTLLALDAILQWQEPLNPFPKPQQTARWFWLLCHPQPVLRCVALLAAIAIFHPLMAIHAALFCLVLALVVKRAPLWSFAFLGLACLIIVGSVQAASQAEPPAVQLAVQSRYYWFLSNWRWFEWLGLFGPLAVLFGISASTASRSAVAPFPSTTRVLCRSCLFLGLLSIVLAALFAQEHFTAHTAARLQPLRSFLPIYALLPLLLGGTLSKLCNGRFGQRTLLWSMILASAGAMFLVQRATFPQSPNIEWPGRPNPNSWAQAFVWIRQHTPANALFALDAHYINTAGEDAQSFRALALRSMVPDFSKDGGEAANFPKLAPAWLIGADATRNLSQLSDAERELRFSGFGVHWLILKSSARTGLVCPYRNETVMVCHR